MVTHTHIHTYTRAHTHAHTYMKKMNHMFNSVTSQKLMTAKITTGATKKQSKFTLLFPEF